MSFFEYYIYANIYLLGFWILYKVWIAKSSNFALSRLFLLSSVLLSLTFPLLQDSAVGLLTTYKAISASSFSENTLGIVYRNVEFIQPVVGDIARNINPFLLIFLGGAVLSLLLISINHVKINRIIYKSNRLSSAGARPWIYLSNEIEIPYLYINKIVLPGSKTQAEQALLVEHEKLHYRYGHHFDTLMFSIFQIFFWLNPLVYLMNRSLKLIHEYQVDQRLVKGDFEAEVYMNTLLKYSIVSQRNMLVNAFSKTNLKKRFIMINNYNHNKQSWRFYASIPGIILLFAFISFACTNTDNDKGVGDSSVIEDLDTEASINKSDQETEPLEIVSLDYTEETKFFATSKNSVSKTTVFVLINRYSQMLVDGEKHTVQDSEEAILTACKEKIEYALDQDPDKFATLEGPIFNLSMQNDIATKQEDIVQVHQNIVSAITQIRNEYAKQTFDLEFNQLSSEQQKRMKELIPLRIYVPGPKNIGGES